MEFNHLLQSSIHCMPRAIICRCHEAFDSNWVTNTNEVILLCKRLIKWMCDQAHAQPWQLQTICKSETANAQSRALPTELHAPINSSWCLWEPLHGSMNLRVYRLSFCFSCVHLLATRLFSIIENEFICVNNHLVDSVQLSFLFVCSIVLRSLLLRLQAYKLIPMLPFYGLSSMREHLRMKNDRDNVWKDHIFYDSDTQQGKEKKELIN